MIVQRGVRRDVIRSHMSGCGRTVSRINTPGRETCKLDYFEDISQSSIQIVKRRTSPPVGKGSSKLDMRLCTTIPRSTWNTDFEMDLNHSRLRRLTAEIRL